MTLIKTIKDLFNASASNNTLISDVAFLKYIVSVSKSDNLSKTGFKKEFVYNGLRTNSNEAKKLEKKLDTFSNGRYVVYDDFLNYNVAVSGFEVGFEVIPSRFRKQVSSDVVQKSMKLDAGELFPYNELISDIKAYDGVIFIPSSIGVEVLSKCSIYSIDNRGRNLITEFDLNENDVISRVGVKRPSLTLTKLIWFIALSPYLSNNP